MTGPTLIAYVDESGDTGVGSHRSSSTYTLGCVLVRADQWAEVFEGHLDLRRRLRDRFGVKVRDEVKAQYLVRGSGSLKSYGLAPAERRLIYRAHLRHAAADGRLAAFAVVGHKSGRVGGLDLGTAVWTPLLQRLERTSAQQGANVIIIHDEGENPAIRKLARWSRRRRTAGSVGGSGSITRPFLQLVDDPVPKASHESYLLQLADLVAYAAWRRLYAPSPTVAEVVPGAMWHNLGPAILSQGNALRTITTPGIVEVRY